MLTSYLPVIIIGAGRSGTNMLRDVLTRLPGCVTWPCDEINYIWRHGNRDHPTDEFTPQMASLPVKSFIRRSFDSLHESYGGTHVIEKTCANSLRVGFVREVLPDAYFIHLVRDGRDVVVSAAIRWTAPLDLPYVVKKARFVPLSDMPFYASRYLINHAGRILNGEKRLSFWGPRFIGLEDMLGSKSLLEICAHQWARCVTRAGDAFPGISPERILELRYEDFVAEPFNLTSQITDFLSIRCDSDLVRYAVSSVSQKSVGNWRRQLSKQAITKIAPILNPVLKKYHYED
ncbi:sulfotransferase family protein [Desulfoferrobacter suflitae]|uniref:sulfotransferase family protein n=1 Tax=Desulfoferrobacter suflitae TaxID=2865782 RepID=UPI0021649015|nr:sulfotransferase [Desulfoferrobacter suflitae]MCK8604354.1 sulfotransferase [Desulfoferrobacter suflitae]